MKKIIRACALLLATIVLSACQPTPTEVFVVEKDTERMVEKANSDENGTVANSLGIPSGRYTYAATDASGRVKVEVDAEVLLPDVEYLPVARINGRSFTEQDARQCWNVFDCSNLGFLWWNPVSL